MSIHGSQERSDLQEDSADSCKMKELEDKIRNLISELENPDIHKPFDLLKKVNVEGNITRKVTMTIEKAANWYTDTDSKFEELFNSWWKWIELKGVESEDTDDEELEFRETKIESFNPREKLIEAREIIKLFVDKQPTEYDMMNQLDLPFLVDTPQKSPRRIHQPQPLTPSPQPVSNRGSPRRNPADVMAEGVIRANEVRRDRANSWSDSVSHMSDLSQISQANMGIRLTKVSQHVTDAVDNIRIQLANPAREMSLSMIKGRINQLLGRVRENGVICETVRRMEMEEETIVAWTDWRDEKEQALEEMEIICIGLLEGDARENQEKSPG